MPAEAVEIIESDERLNALELGVYLAGGALIGAYGYPLIYRGVDRHTGALEGAVIGGVSFLFNKWRERRRAAGAVT
jgi:hypothetical protein